MLDQNFVKSDHDVGLNDKYFPSVSGGSYLKICQNMIESISKFPPADQIQGRAGGVDPRAPLPVGLADFGPAGVRGRDGGGGRAEAGALAGRRAQDVRRAHRQDRRREVGDRPPDQGAENGNTYVVQ